MLIIVKVGIIFGYSNFFSYICIIRDVESWFFGVHDEHDTAI